MSVQVEQSETFAGRVRTMQIIIAALVMGLLSFLMILLFALPGQAAAPGTAPFLTLFGIGFGFIMLVVRAIVVRAVTNVGRRGIVLPDREAPLANTPDATTQKLLALYQTRLIVGAACLEGAAFFLLIAHLIERSPWSLAAAIALILCVAAHIPTRQRVADFVEQQTTQLEQERQFESNKQA